MPSSLRGDRKESQDGEEAAQKLLHLVEVNDFALPVEFDRDRSTFAHPMYRAFPSLGRVDLFAFRSPKPHTRPVRLIEFQGAGHESTVWGCLAGRGEIRDDIVVMHVQGHRLTDFGILDADLGIHIDYANRSPEENKIGLQF